MELMIKGDFAKQLLAQAKSDRGLAEALARQYVASVDPAALRVYLLTPQVALALLAERLRKHPEQTIVDLQKLPEGKPGARAPGKTRATKAVKAPRRRKRQRLSTARIEQIKDHVRKFLGSHPWSNRKRIATTASIPTPAIYNRIITELKQAGLIIAKGQKAKTVYALKGAKPAKAATPAKRAVQKKRGKKR
jgi:hypothetical protein